MKKSHRFALGIAAVMVAGAAHATPYSTDVGDLWYSPDEPGWGLSLYQQQGTVFGVLFVYGANNQPTWYVASSMVYGPEPQPELYFRGPLYQTTGPYFGAGTFNPAAVGTRQVGSITFTLTNLTTGRLAYTADGVSVTRNLVRQTWAINNMSGSYLGGQSGTYSGCPAAGSNGTRDEPGTLQVDHATAGGAILTLTTAAFTCTYNGAYGQGGHFGLMTGSFSCSNGSTGSFSAFTIDAQITGLSARIETAASNGCRYAGRMGGIRRAS